NYVGFLCRLLAESAFFFFPHASGTELYTLSLHDALPISVNPVPTWPAYRRPSAVWTPTSSEPIVPLRRPPPGFHPHTTTSWVRKFFTFTQSGERRPGRYGEASRLATTPSRPSRRDSATARGPAPW